MSWGSRTQANRGGDPLLSVRDLHVRSRLGGASRAVVSELTLSVRAGETIGIVGESGSGKSITARAILGLLPTGLTASGEVRLDGRDLLTLSERELCRVRGGDIGLVMQDPFTMLNPLLRCGRHLDDTMRAGGRSAGGRATRRAEVVRRLAEVGIRDEGVADRYPFQLSGGMRQRVGIAASLARDPRLLIADEPSAALDVTTEAEILALLRATQQQRGLGLVMITHDLRVAFSMCDRVYVLYAGSLLEVARGAALDEEPLHPYTLGLLLSKPPEDTRAERLPTIAGSVPRPDEVEGRCVFAPRCAWATEACNADRPPLKEVALGRWSACLRIPEIREQLRATRTSPVGRMEVSVATTDRLVKVRDVHKTFENGGAVVQALGGVSIEVGENEGVGIVGESGSGKTTLGRCLVGLERPTSGAIEIAGVDAANYEALGSKDRSHVRSAIQMVFQDPYSSLNPRRSVGSTLVEAVSAGQAGTRERDKEASKLLELVGLPAAYAARKPIALSGGERQRVAIARAIAVRPRVIVCDEAVSALDVSVQAQILNLLNSLRAELGMSYVFISHDLAVVRQVVERVYVMLQGEIVEAGPIETVFARPQHPYTARLVESAARSGERYRPGPSSALGSMA